MMETLFGLVFSAAFAYLLNDMQILKKEVLSLHEDVIWVQAKLDRRNSPKEDDNRCE